jgi:hypothetical protein
VSSRGAPFYLREEIPGGDHGSLNGVTPVELAPAPAAGFVRCVERLSFDNIDTGAVTIRVRKTVAGPADYEFDSVAGLAVDSKYISVTKNDPVVLAVGESITAVMDAAAASDDPTWLVSWVDIPVVP